MRGERKGRELCVCRGVGVKRERERREGENITIPTIILYSLYYRPGTILNALHILTHLIF